MLTAASGLQADELRSVRYSAFRVADAAYVAKVKGFFSGRKLDVEFVENPGGTTGLQAVATGRTEAGGAPIAPLLFAANKGLDVVGVADFQSAVADFPFEEFFVRADSGIDEVSDLKGKRIAVNSVGGSFQFTVFSALESANMARDDVQFVVLPFDKQLPALLTREVDMVGLLPPFSTKAVTDFGDEIALLFTALDVFGEKQFVVYVLNGSWARENPEIASDFVAALVEAMNWIEANPAEGSQLMAEYVGVEPKYMPVFRFQPSGRVVRDDVAFWKKVLVSSGASIEGVDLDLVVTNRYNPFIK